MTGEPAWLVAKVDQHMKKMRPGLEGAIAATQPQIVMTLLTEPPDGSTDEERERWERTCDNCGTYCDENTPFWIGQVAPMIGDVQVIIAFGTCEACKGKD